MVFAALLKVFLIDAAVFQSLIGVYGFCGAKWWKKEPPSVAGFNP